MSALVINQKFAGLNGTFRAEHAEFGPGRVDYIKPNGKKAYFVADGAEKGKFVRFDELRNIVVQYHKMFGALTKFQARHLQRLAEASQTTLQYFSKVKHGGKWKKAGNPTWKFTTNYRVILH